MYCKKRLDEKNGKAAITIMQNINQTRRHAEIIRTLSLIIARGAAEIKKKASSRQYTKFQMEFPSLFAFDIQTFLRQIEGIRRLMQLNKGYHNIYKKLETIANLEFSENNSMKYLQKIPQASGKFLILILNPLQNSKIQELP
ncbi:hypothetical protein ABPG74_003483 [Tetrahymena malaccensis]